MFSGSILGWLLCLALSMFARADYYIDDQNATSLVYSMADNAPKGWGAYQEGRNTLQLGLINGTKMTVDASQCFNHTFTFAACNFVDDCQVQIPFTGSGITINVLQAGQQGVNASLTIDGGAPTYNVLPSPSGPNFEIPSVTLFNVQGIPNDDHTATLTVLDWENSLSYMMLDYALIHQVAASPTTTAISHSTLSASSKSTATVDLIVGGTVGGVGAVAALAAISFSYFWCCRRRSKRLSMNAHNAPMAEPFFDPESLYTQHTGTRAVAVRQGASDQTPATSSPVAADHVTDMRALPPSSPRSGSDPSLPAKLRPGVPANPSSTSQDQLVHTSIMSTPQRPSSSAHDARSSGTPTSLLRQQGQRMLSEGQADLVNRLNASHVPANVIAYLIERMLAGRGVEGSESLPPPSYRGGMAGEDWGLSEFNGGGLGGHGARPS